VFASIDLAARIDRAEARLTESVTRAAIETSPGLRAFVGSTSQENAHRQGFALLYPRAILVKEPTQ
jgi:hypothetical protein